MTLSLELVALSSVSFSYSLDLWAVLSLSIVAGYVRSVQA